MDTPVCSFGDVAVDLRRMLVTRAGEAVAVEPKSFDVLRYLLEHHDRLVTKDELLDVVWKDTFVTPNALTRAVAQLRKALGDDAREARYIETVSKRGYRFIARIDARADDPRAAAAGDEAVGRPRVTVAVGDRPIASTSKPRSRRRLGLASLVLLAAFGLILIVVGGRFRTPAAVARQPAVARLTVTGNVVDAAVSPDGHYLVYAQSAGGQQSLWLQQVGTAGRVQLVPSAPVGYFGTSFSRDGRSIYYVVKGPRPLADPGGVLARIPTLGGAPQPLLAGIDSRVTFSPDGARIAFFRVAFPGAGGTALMLANADGTGARLLAQKRTPDGFLPSFFGAPCWSPGGDTIVAAVQNAATDRARLMAFAVKDGSERPLSQPFASIGSAEWLPDGSGVVFVGAPPHAFWSNLGGQIWLQPVPNGEPRRLVTDFVQYRNVSITADGNGLVSVGMMHEASPWLVPLEGPSEPRKLPSLSEAGIRGLAWLSPGRVVLTTFDTGGPQITSVDTTTGGRRELTAIGWSTSPRPSPDGRSIYFFAQRDGRSGVWRMDADGGGSRELATAWTATGPLTDLNISPDGNWLVFTSRADDLDSTWRMPATGGSPTLLVPGLTMATFSPDGRFLAGHWRPAPGAMPRIAIFGTGETRPVQTFDVQLPATPVGGVWWARDGRGLFYTTVERSNVWYRAIDGGEPRRVTAFGDGTIYTGDMSPDHGQLLVIRGNDTRDAFLVSGFR